MLDQKIAKQRLDEMIEKGKANVLKVIDQIQNQVPEDLLVPARKLTFAANKDAHEQAGVKRLGVYVGENDVRSIHTHALGQIAERGEIELAYAKRLLDKGPWGAELLADNLNELYAHQGKKYLIRAVKTEVRGFLSDAFRRLDSRPIVDAFCGELQRLGAMPYQGYALDTRINIQAIVPRLETIAGGEIVVFGMTLGNSDFGDGALEATSFVIRLKCNNGAIGQDVLRKVHIGKRLSDDIVFSQETYRLDTETAVSSIKDVTRNILGEQRIAGYLEAVNKSAEEELTPGAVSRVLGKYLNKGEVEKVIDLYKSADVEMLPPGNTTWRLSNAVSWLANTAPDITAEKKLDLQHIAGEILLPQAA